MKLKKLKLKNGLKVLLVESRKSPVVSVQMWVRTGSADEKKGEEGISHFIEHLLFKGTRKYKTGEIAALVEGNGGELNAYTSYDQTVFYVTISSAKANIALDVISEMMGFPLFDKQEIDNERDVVLEEIKRGEDSLGQVAWKELFSTVYKTHSYKTPIIGFSENIRNLSPAKIKKYYQTRYVPSNMFLIVTGDFEAAEMAHQVKEYFGDFKPYALEKRTRKKEGPQKKQRIEVVPTAFKKTQVYLAWPAPSIKSKDVPALDLLSMVLGTGDSSRLAQKLRLDNLLAQNVGSMAYTPLNEGVFAISMTGEASALMSAMKEALEVALELMRNPPTAEEMKKAISILSSEDIYSMETVDGLSRKIGSDEFYMKDPEYFNTYLKAVHNLKPQDISRVARKYMKPDAVNAVFLSEQGTEQVKKEIEELTKWYRSEYKKVTRKPVKAIRFSSKPLKVKATQAHVPETEVLKRPSGLTLVLRKQSDTPTFSLRCAALGGIRAERAQDGGVIELLARTWTTGSENYTENQINQIVESNSAGLSAFGGRNTLGLTLDGLSPSQEELYPIYFELLGAPRWEPQKVEREKQVQLQQIKNKLDNPAQVCFHQFHQLMFGSHPYSQDVLGTEASLKNLNTDRIKHYEKSLLQLNDIVMTAVGDFDRDLLEAHVEKLEKSLSRGSRFDRKIKLENLDRDMKSRLSLQKEQVHIVLGYRGLTITSDDRLVLDVIQSVLSGQGGRLFYELRDKNSLAYTVAPIRMEGIEPGYFGSYIGCSPEKTEKAIEMMRAELHKLTKELISDDEMTRAKNYLVGQQAISLQRKSTVCQSILLDVVYGLDADHKFTVIDEYEKISAKLGKERAKKLFAGPEVLSIVGPV